MQIESITYTNGSNIVPFWKLPMAIIVIDNKDYVTTAAIGNTLEAKRGKELKILETSHGKHGAYTWLHGVKTV